MHKYLIADQTKFNEKIIEVFNNGEVMRELIEKCIKQDYYSLLILSNVVTSECDLIK